MMVKSFQSTYWDAAQEGMKKASEELGVTYKAQGPNSESDIADQVNMINTAIASNPVGLGLAACDTSSVHDALKTCADKGIPVVTFDTGIADAPEGSVVCEVCTDNAQAGAVAAENMYNAIKDVVKMQTDRLSSVKLTRMLQLRIFSSVVRIHQQNDRTASG